VCSTGSRPIGPHSTSSLYNATYAEFFEWHYTGWVREFSQPLANHLADRVGGQRSVLDMCCGSGETSACSSIAVGWSPRSTWHQEC
jgi:hypothetical protein